LLVEKVRRMRDVSAGELNGGWCDVMGEHAAGKQVCHHPTVLAMHAEGRGWTMCGDANIRSKFFGRCIELSPLGTIEVRWLEHHVQEWWKSADISSGGVTETVYCLIAG
jgi:hypothetical protein